MGKAAFEQLRDDPPPLDRYVLVLVHVHVLVWKAAIAPSGSARSRPTPSAIHSS